MKSERSIMISSVDEDTIYKFRALALQESVDRGIKLSQADILKEMVSLYLKRKRIKKQIQNIADMAREI